MSTQILHILFDLYVKNIPFLSWPCLSWQALCKTNSPIMCLYPTFYFEFYHICLIIRVHVSGVHRPQCKCGGQRTADSGQLLSWSSGFSLGMSKVNIQVSLALNSPAPCLHLPSTIGMQQFTHLRLIIFRPVTQGSPVTIGVTITDCAIFFLVF